MAESLKTDVLVVGAGPAGAIIAARVAQAGRRVLLAERGPKHEDGMRRKLLETRLRTLRPNDFDDHVKPEEKTAPVVSTDPRPWTYLSASGVGGASLHWGGHTPRPTAEDLRVRSLFGYGRDWPISYAELEPWLLEAEHELGVSANADNPYASPRSGAFPMPAHAFSHFESAILAPGLARLGWKAHSRPNAVNSAPYRGRSACMACRACTACPSGARYAADQVHVPQLLAQPTGSLVSGLALRRLELGKDGKRVTAAHCVRLSDKAEVVIEAGTVVLALGGVETPRRLLLSAGARHHKGGLGNAGGQLGRGFTDHQMSFWWYELAQPVGRALAFPAMNCEHFRGKPGRDVRGTYSINLIPMPVEWDWVPPFMMEDMLTSGDRLTLSELRRGLSRAVVGYGMHEMSSTGTLALDATQRDSLGDLLAHVKLVATERDRAGLDHLKQLQPELAGALGARRHWDYWSRGESFFASHPSGGAAMGRTPEDGVCDRDARVFGLDNLYLAGSAVFPHLGAANPTLTIAALALRLAKHLTGAPS